jgi:uncharacterized repeat protein (TIGR03803 family)
VNTDGTGYAVLKHFTGGDGANPSTGLTVSGSVLYGTTLAGGSWNNGTAFKIDLASGLNPIPLTAQIADGAIILHWSDPAFALQAAPTVMGTYTNIPGATSPHTNAVIGPQQFFRLLGN